LEAVARLDTLPPANLSEMRIAVARPGAISRTYEEETASMRGSTGPRIAALVAIGEEAVSASPAQPLHRRRERA
jgi:hypothetical protein